LVHDVWIVFDIAAIYVAKDFVSVGAVVTFNADW